MPTACWDSVLMLVRELLHSKHIWWTAALKWLSIRGTVCSGNLMSLSKHQKSHQSCCQQYSKDVFVPVSFYGAADPERKATEAIWRTLREQEGTKHTVWYWKQVLTTMKPKLMKYTKFLLKLWKPWFHLHLFHCTDHGKTYFFQNSHFIFFF